jgi:hypothetical protein
MLEFWNPVLDATFFFVVISATTWALVKWGRRIDEDDR